MQDLRDVYAKKSISQIPRLLTCLDRNPYSPTYGCFHRDYWLYKTSDFADAVRQFGVHALALVYKYDFPDNIYKGHQKIKGWTIAAILYWTKIQHKDGSFDEFYPYERGWVGPTAFTTYTICESYQIIKDEIGSKDKQIVEEAIRKAAYFIGKGETEEDHLANHHAMACLTLWKSYEVLKEEKIKELYRKAFNTFLSYHNEDEGWSREYDGVDPGYLSATVSFLGKVYQSNKDAELLKVLKQSVEFSSYFVYPNGFYAGSLGSRNTLHFYPHGYEILGNEIPLANSIAQKMLQGLAEGKLVPPEIMSDRYLFYRVPEFLLAYLDYTPKIADHTLLPYEKKDLDLFFKRAGIFVKTSNNHYIIANLAKGGVIKAFNLKNGKPVLNDCGIVGQLADGRMVTSQWVDPTYKIDAFTNGWTVSGKFNLVPSNKLFSLFKNLLFRAILFVLGPVPAFAHYLKGKIRKTLILGQRNVPIEFMRSFKIENSVISLSDEIIIKDTVKFISLSIGDEFFVRYVPQSRFFQSQELEVEGKILGKKEIDKLNKEKRFIFTREIKND